MRRFSAQDILDVWEQGESLHPVDQALLLLTAGFPEEMPEDLMVRSVGQRNDLLFELREQIFGPEIRGYAECPQCGERLEFSAQGGAFRVKEGEETANPFHWSEQDETFQLRLPNSLDLAAATTCTDMDAGRRLLVKRCVLQVIRQGTSIPPSELSEDDLNRLARRIAELDPQAEVVLDFLCPTCGARWQGWLEIASFLWAEISALAKRLLREVHAIASAYGWREADILRMSPFRRNCYLELIG